jgi:predicted RNA-binding protein
MNYWIYVTTSDNWTVTKKRNLLGVPERNKNAIVRVEKGDRCLVYVKQERVSGKVSGATIVGAYEIASEVFHEPTKVFSTPQGTSEKETFSLRMKMKPLSIFEKPIEFKPLVEKLEFIKNKNNYGPYLRGRALIQIGESDYKLIESAHDSLKNGLRS